MGMLEDMMGKMGGQAPGAGAGAGGGQGALVQAVLGMLAGGGLQSILQGFNSNGLGQILQSWIGTGANQPVTPDQVRQSLGEERISQLAQQTGMEQSTVASQLSQLLPGLVDKLTPNGQLPEGGALEQGLGMLRSFMK
jgi:uncharacterized protein YidB (DUF937 family)